MNASSVNGHFKKLHYNISACILLASTWSHSYNELKGRLTNKVCGAHLRTGGYVSMKERENGYLGWGR